MEEKSWLSKDEVYFLVFFSNFFIDQSYCLIGITLIQYVHFLYLLEFFCCLYYLFKILIKKYPLRNFIKSNDV
jgi:hypothetical protein